MVYVQATDGDIARFFDWPMGVKFICKHMIRIKIKSTYCEIALNWLQSNTLGDKQQLLR